MGHYDAQYEAQYKQDRENKLSEARATAKKHHTKILKSSDFALLGVCDRCAGRVYSIPNWGCHSSNCPHKP
jgi:hypothetical protein